MTLMLETISHGEIESGFYAAFMQLARLGEYSFPTRHLCEVVQYFAKNDASLETKAIAYDLEAFKAGEREYHQKLARFIKEIEFKEIKKSGLDKQLEKLNLESTLKSGKDIRSQGKIIPIIVAPKEDSITIGEYKIASFHFGRFAYYLAHGGFCGWPGKMPQFAEETMAALKNSDRRLYQQIRQELEEIIKSEN